MAADQQHGAVGPQSGRQKAGTGQEHGGHQQLFQADVLLAVETRQAAQDDPDGH